MESLKKIGAVMVMMVSAMAFNANAATHTAPTYTYEQGSGRLNGSSASGARVTSQGYSGASSAEPYVSGRNNSSLQYAKNYGPIPQGRYEVTKCDNSIGKNTAHLQPVGGTYTNGRDGFRIHGNNSTNNASTGCIIADPYTRSTICSQVNQGQRVTVDVVPSHSNYSGYGH